METFTLSRKALHRPGLLKADEQEKIKRRERALDARPWARAQIDRVSAERRAKRAEAWFRTLVEHELAERRAERARISGPVTLLAPPLSGPN
jgi:hypothetical protein